jgi:hypothetical protein
MPLCRAACSDTCKHPRRGKHLKGSGAQVHRSCCIAYSWWGFCGYHNWAQLGLPCTASDGSAGAELHVVGPTELLVCLSSKWVKCREK